MLVLDPPEFRLLEGLRLNPRRTFAGKVRGERLTRRRGVSIDFADYREYVEGDDLRHLDWNVLERLDHPVVKTYQDEEDLAVHLLLDDSASMGFGEPTKFAAAVRLGAALGYLALNGGDALYPRRLGGRDREPAAWRGRTSYPKFARWLAAAEPMEGVGLASALRAFAAGKARTGLAIVLSDGLDPEAPAALRRLGTRGHEVLFVQILSALDLDPDIEGDLRLLDADGGAPVEITANSATLREYRRRLQAHTEALKDAAARSGGRFVQATAESSLRETLHGPLRRSGAFV